MNIDTPVVSYVVSWALFLKSKTANLCGLAVFKNGGLYWTRTSDLFHVKETL